MFFRSSCRLRAALWWLGAAACVAAPEAPLARDHDLTLESRGCQLVLKLPGTGSRGLLAPDSVLGLSEGTRRRPHRLLEGELLVARIEGDRSRRPVIVEVPVGGYQVSTLEGGFQLEVSAGGPVVVRAALGRTLIFGEGRERELEAGQQAFLLPASLPGPGSPTAAPRLEIHPAPPLAPLLARLEAIGSDRVRWRPGSPLRGAVRLTGLEGATANIGWVPVDPELGSPHAEARPLQYWSVPGRASLAVPHGIRPPSATDQAIIRAIGDDGRRGGISIRTRIQRGSGGLELVNFVTSGTDNGAGVLLGDDLRALTSPGGSMTVTQRVDENLAPLAPPRVAATSGYVFFQTGADPGGRRRAGTLRPGGSSCDLAARRQTAAVLQELFLAAPGAPPDWAVVGKELKAVLDWLETGGGGRPAGAVPRTAPGSVPLGIVSLMKVVPIRPGELADSLPVHLEGSFPSQDIDIALAASGLGGDGGPGYLLEVAFRELAGRGPRLEAIPLSIPRGLPLQAGMAAITLSRATPGHPVFELVKTLREMKLLVIRPLAATRVNLALLQVPAMVFIGIIGLLALGSLARAFYEPLPPPEIRCPHCRRAMVPEPLLHCDPVLHLPILSALEPIQMVQGPEEAAEFGKRLAPLVELMNGADRDDPRSVDVHGYWCARCQDGVVLNRYVRDDRVVDEKLTPFHGPEAWSQLRVSCRPRGGSGNGGASGGTTSGSHPGGRKSRGRGGPSGG